MHFFVAELLSIAVVTYTYTSITSETYDRLIRYAHMQRINFSMRPQHVRMTRDPTAIV